MIKEGRKRETHRKRTTERKNAWIIIINTKKTIKINILIPAINLTTFINAPETNK